MCTWFLQNYFKKILLDFVLGRSHMGTLGAKTSQWLQMAILQSRFLPYRTFVERVRQMGYETLVSHANEFMV
jgi:hypothetical protein